MQRVLTVMLLVGLTAACSGDDDVSESTTTPPESVTVVTTTEPPPTTVAPTTTAPVTTEPAPTTEATSPTTEPPPTTTDPPPTTVDPLADLAGSIQRDLTAGDEVWQDVVADPMAPDAEERLERYFRDQALNFLLDLLENYRADGLTVMPSSEIPPSIETLDAPELIPESEPPMAMVTVCQIDSGILMAPVSGTDARFPINDDVIRVIARVTVDLVDGVWAMSNGGDGDEEVGETTCE